MLLQLFHKNHQLRRGPWQQRHRRLASCLDLDLAPSHQDSFCSAIPPTEKEMEAGAQRTWSWRPQQCFEMTSKEEEAKRVECSCFENSVAVQRSGLSKATVKVREALHASVLFSVTHGYDGQRERGGNSLDNDEILANGSKRISQRLSPDIWYE